MSIAPWQVEICCLQSDDAEVKCVADKLYDDLQKSGVEVLYDDRAVRPGFMFADADLFGIPLRAVVSRKNFDNAVIEISYRDKSYKGEIPIDDAAVYLKKEVDKLLDAYRI